MIDWPVVAAFVGPLLTGLGLVAALFAYLGRKRDKKVDEQIKSVTAQLATSQLLMQQQIAQVVASQAAQAAQLNRQDELLSSALQSIARVEGRLSGPLQVTMREAPA